MITSKNNKSNTDGLLKTSDIRWSRDFSGSQLLYNVGGRGGGLQARVNLALAGTLNVAAPSSSLTDSIMAEYAEHDASRAYHRILEELKDVQVKFEDAEKEHRFQTERYSSVVAADGNIKSAKTQMAAASSVLQALESQRDVLLAGANESRQAAAAALNRLAAERKNEALTAAKKRFDDSLASIAEYIKTELPILCEARQAIQRAGATVDPNRLLTPLPSLPVEEPEPVPVMHKMRSTMGFGEVITAK